MDVNSIDGEHPLRVLRAWPADDLVRVALMQELVGLRNTLDVFTVLACASLNDLALDALTDDRVALAAVALAELGPAAVATQRAVLAC